MEFLNENLGWILTAILGLIGLVFGTKWTALKAKLAKSVKEGADVIKQAIALVEYIDTVLADDKVTQEEIAEVKNKAAGVTKEWKELIAVWKKDPEMPVE